jgi:hypothetical protein
MSRRRLRFGPTLLLTFAASAVGAPAGAQTAADASPARAGPTVNAVWTEHEFTFTYFGRGTYYSCDGMANTIEYILEALGARPEPKVWVGCTEGLGIQQIPTARIKVAVPTEATPELLAAIEAGKSKRELVSRVRGDGAVVDVATAQFPAQRQVVEFVGRRKDHIEDGDCELLEQLLPRVLEPLGIREAPGSSLTCTPRTSQFGSVRLRLESLHARPAAVAESVEPARP